MTKVKPNWQLAVGVFFLGSVLIGARAAAAERDDVAATAQLIDRHIFNRLNKEQVQPAELSSDAEFCRRVWLDLAGKIPPATQVRWFLEDERPTKRRMLVESLLARSDYVSHFATYWRNVMMPEVRTDERIQQLLPGFDGWLREHLSRNTPFDVLVREIVNTPLETRGGPRNMRNGGERSAWAFFQAKEIAPENLAAATSRIFLGIRIECAQCHDHPFDDWQQAQFWSYASFFAGIEREGSDGVFGRVQEVFDRRELEIPETGIVVQARYLDDQQPHWERGLTSRENLANWMTAPENPYFARMAVNRIWGKLFGVGLVDPVDDFTDENECSHPELLADLTSKLVEHHFDLKFLIRAITASRTYQLSSTRPTSDPVGDPLNLQLFAAMPVKGLTPEQLLDSLDEVTGFRPDASVREDDPRAAVRNDILSLFINDTDPPTGQQTSIPQALALMNGQFAAAAVDLNRSRALKNIVGKALSPREQVESLFLTTLSRRPSESELATFAAYVEQGGPAEDSSVALADVLWALLNSAEFASNH